MCGYLAVDEDIESVRQRLEHDLWPLQMIARHAGLDFAPTQYKNTQAAHWGESWKQYYKPVRVGKRLVIVPAWEQFALAPSDIPIRIDPVKLLVPDVPSTQLRLTGIEKYVQPGQKVLDLGCGSGILAIAAAQLGANPIYGYDIDPAAIPATAENAAANGIAWRYFGLQGRSDRSTHHRPVPFGVSQHFSQSDCYVVRQGSGAYVCSQRCDAVGRHFGSGTGRRSGGCCCYRGHERN